MLKIKDLLKNINMRLPHGVHEATNVDSAWVTENSLVIRFVKEIDGMAHTADKKIWFPNQEYVTPKDGETPKEALDKTWESRLSDAAIIVSLLSEKSENLNTEISLDADGAAVLVDLINKLAKENPDVKFNIAVEENSNGYSNLAKYGFIELHKEGEQPTLSVKKIKPKEEEEDAGQGQAQKLF